jgi:predicted ATPase
MIQARTVELDFSRIHVSGRQDELAQLQNSLQRVPSNEPFKHEATPSGTTQVVLIEGTSGSGKSALVEAFREAVADQNYIFCMGKFEENWLVAEPFSAFVDCISSLLDALFQKDPAWMEEMDGDTIAQIRIVSIILPHRFRLLLLKSHDNENDNENDDLSISTASLSDLDFKSQWGFDRLRLAVRALLRTVCNILPVVLVLEDLHWGDDESLKLLHTLVTDKQDE